MKFLQLKAALCVAYLKVMLLVLISVITVRDLMFTIVYETSHMVGLPLKIASEMPVPHSLGKYFQHHEI